MMNANTENETPVTRDIELIDGPDLDVEETLSASEEADLKDDAIEASRPETDESADSDEDLFDDEDENEAVAEDEADEEPAAEPVAAAPVAVDPNAPAYEVLMTQVASVLAVAPVTVGENKGFIKIESKVNGHKIYIAKQKVKAPRIETTVTLDAGFQPLAKPNGRIAGTIDPTPEVLTAAIAVLSDKNSKIRAPLRKAA